MIISKVVIFSSVRKILKGTTAIVFFLCPFLVCQAQAADKEVSVNDIRLLTAFGERANYSPDGERIVFIGKNYGDAFEIEVETGKIKNISSGVPHQGMHRIQFLPDGNYLVTAPRIYSGVNTRASMEMWILDKSLDKGLQPLEEMPLEGIAVSKKSNLIAWTAVEPRVQLEKGQPWQMLFSKPTKRYVAEVSYHNGVPRITNKREIMNTLPEECSFIEPQDFRDDDRELVFSCLKFSGKVGMHVSVMGYRLESKEYITYRSREGEYNEIEGLFPGGKRGTVECGEQVKPGIPPLEVCILELKPDGRMTRLFSDSPEGAMDEYSNPVVSPDGKQIVFQKSARTESEYGEGLGLYIVNISR